MTQMRCAEVQTAFAFDSRCRELGLLLQVRSGRYEKIIGRMADETNMTTGLTFGAGRGQGGRPM